MLCSKLQCCFQVVNAILQQHRFWRRGKDGSSYGFCDGTVRIAEGPIFNLATRRIRVRSSGSRGGCFYVDAAIFTSVIEYEYRRLLLVLRCGRGWGGILAKGVKLQRFEEVSVQPKRTTMWGACKANID